MPSGDTALVANPDATVGGHGAQGAVFVFTRSGSTWSQQGELTASDGAAQDEFARAIAISPDGNTALIGAPRHNNVGAAYVFTRSGGTWTQRAELIEPANSNPFNGFGDGVAIAGNTALIASPLIQGSGATAGEGVVYVFTGSGATWSPQATLTTGVKFDYFGLTMALSANGDTALIGAQTAGADPHGTGVGTGSAYVYTGSGANWTLQQRLTAGDGAVGDQFGAAVSLSASGDAALVGARRTLSVAPFSRAPRTRSHASGRRGLRSRS